MRKKILIAVDASIHSKQTVGYSVKMSAMIHDLHYTIFNVQKSISQFLLDEAEKDSKVREELSKVIKENESASLIVLDKYKKFMVQRGIGSDRIEIVSGSKIESIAKDILVFGQKVPYDAVVVGRRGVSRIQKTFMGSVTSNILEHCTAIPVWLVDGTVMPSKIMVAIDGSESSMRAVDHLCFMVGEDISAEIVIFHVISGIQKIVTGKSVKNNSIVEKIISESIKQNIDQTLSTVENQFEKAGLKKSQIHVKTSKRFLNPGKAIIDESEKGNYGTVVIGRSGISRSIFTGSVSRYVINHISNRALWIVS